jgi:hypothetical protein
MILVAPFSGTASRRTGCSSWPSAGDCPWCCSPRGGGGRPGDVDMPIVAGLDQRHQATQPGEQVKGGLPLLCLCDTPGFMVGPEADCTATVRHVSRMFVTGRQRGRARVYEATVAAAYERGRGVGMASYFEIDDVIDPADSRRWIRTLFDPPAPGWWERRGKRRSYVDTW